MGRPIFDTVTQLLAPETLSGLLDTPVATVSTTPFKTVDSLSSAGFRIVRPVGPDGGPGRRLVLKRFSYDTDWVMRACDDRRGRAVVVWACGLLDGLPAGFVHGYVACARNGDGWAILMDDLGEYLIPPGDTPIAEADHDCLIAAMARLHAHFWGRAELADPALGFSRLETEYTALSPATGEREAGGTDPVPQIIPGAWDLLAARLDPVLARALLDLAKDPAPLCAALRAYPHTIVHADWKLGNLGLIPGEPPRVILLDWARLLAAPPLMDLAWYLAVNSARLPVSKEATIRTYRRHLAADLGERFDEADWQPQLELSLLGAFLQLGWSKAWGAVHGPTDEVRHREAAELTWWLEPVRAGLKRL